jgi:flagellar protein FlaD
MSEGEQNQNTREKHLEELELSAELTVIVERNLLPSRITQKIGEKIKEKNIKVTKDQLYKLVEKIQSALRSYTPSPSNQPEQQKKEQGKEEKKPWNDTVVQTTDMKKLVETVEHLNERLKVIEEQRIDGIKGVSGKLVKTKDIKTLEPADILQEEIQPLEQIPNDPESIVVIMKWLQYLVDKASKNNLPDILDYYVDIGWISDDVRYDLLSYSKGITEETAQTGTRTSHLPTRDHLQSLLFIQKLKGVQLDERFLGKIERDMEKMVKSLEGYQLK